MSTAAFWNKTATKYAKRPVPDEAVYARKLAITRDLLTPDSQVLELGCGTGTTALHHAPYVKHIDAWDISDSMLALAREKMQAKDVTNVDFRQAEAEPSQLPSEYYDVIMTHSLLHLLGNKDELIAGIFRALKPGGVFVSSTTCLGNTMNWLKIIATPMHRLGLWPKVYFFTSAELEHSLRVSGFDIEVSWLPPKAMAHFFVARKRPD